MDPNLYNIQNEYRRIAERIIEADGEITDEDFKQLEITKEQLQLKAVQFALITKENENDLEAIDKEIKRLMTLESIRSNLNIRLKDLIKNAMILFGIHEIKGENFKINFRKSTNVELQEEYLIPEKYTEQITTVKILKKEIGDDLKKGIEVPGAFLKENQNLQIK